MRTPPLLIGLFFLLFQLGARAQSNPELFAQFYGEKQHLTCGKVLHLIQDSSGYIWIMGTKGLYRFDGKNFVHYSENQGLPPGGMLRALIDRDRKLWVLAMNGELLYKEGERFYRPNDIHFKKAKWINLHPSGALTVACGPGDIWMLKENRFKQIRPKQVFFHLSCVHFMWKDSSTLIAESRLSMYEYNMNTGEDKQIRQFKHGYFTRKFKLGETLVYTNRGSIRNYETHTLLLDIDAEVFDIQQVGKQWWIGTSAGLAIWSPEHPKTPPQWVFDVHIMGIMKDRDNNIWLASTSGFFQVLQPRWIWEFKNTVYSSSAIKKLSLANNALYILGNQSEIWKQQGTGWERQVSYGPMDIGQAHYLTGLHDGTFLSIYTGMIHHISSNPEFVHHSGAFGHMAMPHFSTLSLDKKGIFISYNPEPMDSPNGDYMIWVYRHKAKPVNSAMYTTRIRGVANSSLFELPGGELLLIKSSGWNIMELHETVYVHKDSGVFNASMRFLKPGKIDDSTYIWQDADGSIQTGFPGKRVQSFPNPGFQSNETVSSYCQSPTSLWLVTNRAVYKTATGKERRWKKIMIQLQDGIIRCNDICYWRDSIWIATDDGLLHFAEHDFSIANYRQQVFIDSAFVQQTNNPLFPWKHYERILHLKLGKINYNIPYPEEVYVSVGTEGHDMLKLLTGWQQLNLKGPGEIPVNAFPLPGNTAAGQRLWIMVPYFWWEPLWVKSLAWAILVSLVLFFLIRYARKRISREEEKRVAVQEKLRSLQMQINPHFLYNTLNSIQSYVMAEEPQKTLTYIAEFSMLMRLITEYSHKGFISLKQEVEFLQLYIDLETKRIPFTYSIQLSADSEDDAEHIKVPPLLIQPIVENAVKYGMRSRKTGARLEISFELISENNLCVRVSDNGTGFRYPVEDHFGTALRNTHARLYTLWESNQLPVPEKPLDFSPAGNPEPGYPGACVTLQIPIA